MVNNRMQYRVLFVCLGNICRSPTAEAVMRAQLQQAGLEQGIAVDSAGTSSWHIGEPPDRRAMQAAQARGYDLTPLRGRQIEPADLMQFDLILAMDEANLRDLQDLATTEAQRQRLWLLGDLSSAYQGQDVPDPYFGGAAGFARVLDMIESCVAALITRLRNELD